MTTRSKQTSLVDELIERYYEYQPNPSDFEKSFDEISEISERLAALSDSGAELAKRTVPEEKLVKLRSIIVSQCVLNISLQGNISALLALKEGWVFGFTDSVVYAMIGILYEDGAI